MNPDELAKHYASAFLGTPSGEIVLRDLRAKFPAMRLRFERGKAPCALTAAVRDGESAVMQEIEQAISRGAPLLGVNPTNQP